MADENTQEPGTALAEPTEKFRPRQKVRYTHGKGFSTGKIKRVLDGDKLLIETVNGAEVMRPAANVQPVTKGA